MSLTPAWRSTAVPTTSTMYPVEYFHRDVRLLRLYEGTTQIQQLIIGRELIGRD